MAWENTYLLFPILLVLLASDTQQPKFSIRDHPDSHSFTVTMTALTMGDSGLYFCGILKNDRTVAVLRRVSKSNMVVLIVCGLLSKTLIFTVLFTVSWRSFGGQTMTTQQ
ncbi:CMRF35-like molecule 1 [Chionomys nivalis]|uniref:CMRF35-like molecule 1 n=1 Tax=Chionomys nivalis TaxID=269649 RepID=UPI002598631F|nr:CMRF35-like molecule 1 [Chionomys nivalis]